MAPFSVQGKTAVVTGAASGINFAFARLLLGKGCNVVIADLALQPESEALLKEYSGAAGSARGVFVKTDVSSWEALRGLLDKAVAEFGDYEIVCPGAGVFEPPWTSFWHPPGGAESRDAVDASRYALLDVNLAHPIRTTQLALQHWLTPERAPTQTAAKPKRVLIVASIAGYFPFGLTPLYTASKFGVTGFTRSLADLEPAVGIRVNAVAPGVVRTRLWTESPDKLALVDDDKDAWVTPEEVAEAMLDCLESEDKVGGTVLEVGKGSTRKVTTRNDPGPGSLPQGGMTVSNSADSADALFKSLRDGSWQA